MFFTFASGLIIATCDLIIQHSLTHVIHTDKSTHALYDLDLHIPATKGGRLQSNVDIVCLQHGRIRVESVALTNVTRMNNLLRGTVGGRLRARAIYSISSLPSRTIRNWFPCFTEIFP